MRYLKQTQSVFLVLALVMVLSSALFALEPASPAKYVTSSYNNFSVFTDEELSLIEENLLEGIKSKNGGLQTSCAYFLGEMKSDLALIPLLRLARNGKTEEARIIAGLSLYKIESHIGLHILKGRAQNDNSELVRKTFDRLYKKYVSDKYSF
jgi:hypothetical protein